MNPANHQLFKHQVDGVFPCFLEASAVTSIPEFANGMFDAVRNRYQLEHQEDLRLETETTLAVVDLHKSFIQEEDLSEPSMTEAWLIERGYQVYNDLFEALDEVVRDPTLRMFTILDYLIREDILPVREDEVYMSEREGILTDIHSAFSSKLGDFDYMKYRQDEIPVAMTQYDALKKELLN